MEIPDSGVTTVSFSWKPPKLGTPMIPMLACIVHSALYNYEMSNVHYKAKTFAIEGNQCVKYNRSKNGKGHC